MSSSGALEGFLKEPLVRSYLFYVCVLALKMLLMSILTGTKRMKHKAFANPEDTVGLKGSKVRSDDNVERVRRAHLNDLENIPPFMVVSLIYILTNPSVSATIWLLRTFTLARIAHTIVYAVYPLPQPSRAISWGAGYFITVYMAVKSALHFL